MKLRINLLVSIVLVAWMAVGAAKTGEIELQVTGVKSDRGAVLIALFNDAEGFPGESEKAFRRYKAKIKDGNVHVKLSDLPYGSYAIALIHDENANGKMDKNFLGIPKEGFGASNNPRALFGPPEYEDAAFVLDVSVKAIRVLMRYM